MCKLKLLVSIACVLLLGTSAARAQSFDLLFLVDETGDMTAEIVTLQVEGVSTIATSAIAQLGDVAFGVAGYDDFPVAPFGVAAAGDLEYRVHRPITSDLALLQAGLSALSAGGGGDLADAGLHALHSVATDAPPQPPIGWRPGAARVVLWIGNASSHDGDLEPSYASCCSTVGQADTIDALSTANVVVYAFDTASPGLDASGQASAVTSATGDMLSNTVVAGLTDAIVQAIEGPISAQNSPPIADAGPDQSILLNQNANLSGSAVDPDGDPIVGWFWTVDSAPAGSGGAFDNPFAPDPKFAPDLVGVYVLSLAASDGVAFGPSDSMTLTVTANQPPTAVANADVVAGPVPLTVSFDGSASSDPEGQPLQFVWVFDDGSAASTEVSPTHTYTSTGTFTVLLSVSDTFGAVSISDTITIVVTAATPVPALKGTSLVLLGLLIAALTLPYAKRGGSASR